MYEQTMQGLLARFPREVWPDRRLRLVDRERDLGGGNVLDLLYRDEDDGSLWLVEVKRDAVRESTVDQVLRYLPLVQRAEQGALVRPAVAAPSVSAGGARAAAAAGVHVLVLDEQRLREVAAAHGVDLEQQEDRRAARVRPSRPAGPGTRRHRTATAADVVALVRRVEERFPPGSLDATAPLEVLGDYWALAFPGSSPARCALAAQVSAQVLRWVPGSVVGPRAAGGWTTLRNGLNQVVLSIAVKDDRTSCSFYLPTDVGEQEAAAGRLRLDQVRGKGVWVEAALRDDGDVHRVLPLVAAGLRHQFRLQVPDGPAPVAPAQRTAVDPGEAHRDEVHRRFPPRSLVDGTPATTLTAYWRCAFPDASTETRALAVRLCAAVLAAVPGCSVGPYAPSGWTTLRSEQDEVLVSLAPRSTVLRTSFFLPPQEATQQVAAGRVRVRSTRRGHRWVQTSVNGTADLRAVLALVAHGHRARGGTWQAAAVAPG